MNTQDPPRKGDVIRILKHQCAAQPGTLVTVTGYFPAYFPAANSNFPAGNSPAPAGNSPAPAGNSPAPAGNSNRGTVLYRWIDTAGNPYDNWGATDGCYEIVSRGPEPTP